MDKKFSSILFVCLGNICRSPLAEGIARDLIKQHNLNIKVDSAGTGSWHIGNSPCSNSQKIAKIKGIDISDLRARQVNSKDFDNFDLIIALDSSNFNDLKQIGAKNLKKLGDFGLNGEDIPDPYYWNDFSGFYKVYEMIEYCIKNLLNLK